MNEAGPALRDFTEMERMMRAAPAAAAAMVQPSPPQEGQPRDAQPLPGRTYREEAHARHMAALDPLGGIGERLVMFWSNHFAVSVNKGNPVRMFAGLMEREAIRPHVFGRFADMLLAVERHPAMIIYLDNQQSVGPNSRAGQRRGRGLNENLAREILELHTLGVDGGYGQEDVTALARIITGWTLAAPNGAKGPPGTFRFNPNTHEPGAQALLGRRYPEGGLEQGEAALADIARHPATARHLARKLARHFVADAPPPALTARLEAAFRDSDGDLRQVTLALLDAPEAWSPESLKMRTPQEFLIAAGRVLGRRPTIGQVMQPLNAMGQPVWQPGGPNGYPDGVSDWASPEGVKTRLDVAAAIGRQAAGAVDPRRLLDDAFGAAVSPETRAAVTRAETRHQAIALALMSPEFQRR
jgi:uncharacterized protein (DUF1800 family)